MPPKPAKGKASPSNLSRGSIAPQRQPRQSRMVSLAVRMFKRSLGNVWCRDDDNMTDIDGGHDDDWMHARTLVRPDDQLQLSEAELKEEFTRILTANNPHAPQNIVRYSFKDKQFKQLASVDQLAIHFALDGNLVHKDSDEAKRMLTKVETADAASEHASEAGETAAAEGAEDGEQAEGQSREGREGEEGEEGEKSEAAVDEGQAPVAAEQPAGDKKLTNQFNYSERASQTYNNPLRERGTATEPPPRQTISGNVTQWEIFDAYQEDFEKQEKNKEKKVIPGRKEEEKTKKKLTVVDSQSDDLTRASKPAKIVERMVNQNTYDEVTQDFKYFEDTSDDYREATCGTLLPLWKFSCEKAKKLAVTSLCWSPKYLDLFAVGHGSYDFVKQTTGMILIYTLKNPSFPEFIYQTDSGVMCLDIHPEHPYLIAAGFYDGTVGVFNVTEPKQGPIFMSSAKTGKHTDPVWQVRWQKDDLDNNLNFFSVSSDGRVTCWTLVKSELHFYDIIKLSLEGVSSDGPDGTQLLTLGGGTAFDFHREKDYMFLVGTEEGKVHVCSKAYSSTFLDTYNAHHMAVYKVAWNYFHPRLLITCSADWSVKIWDRGYSKKEPVFTFDLNSAVGDVAWAPYSSTVFAAVTADGKAHVFDLNINKYEPICEQLITPKKKTKLTHISFNSKHPIVIIGDDRGYVTSMKLSPNLRKQPKEKKGAEAMKPEERLAQKTEYEIGKMEKILSMVRQPESIEPKA